MSNTPRTDKLSRTIEVGFGGTCQHQEVVDANHVRQMEREGQELIAVIQLLKRTPLCDRTIDEANACIQRWESFQ